MADGFRGMISDRLRLSADWLDSFFRDERSEIEENKTSLRLRMYSYYEEGEGTNVKARLRLSLVLPELENKFHIMITGESDQDKKFREIPLSEKREIDPGSERNLNLALRYFITATEERNVSFKVGGRIDTFPPVIYAGPRFSVSKTFDPWLLRLTQEVKYFSDDGWESETRFDFERFLKKPVFLRLSTEGSWYEHEPGYFYQLNCSVYHALDQDRVFGYFWNNFFETRPRHRLAETQLGIRYRQKTWREWLFFELIPQVAFREEEDFEPTFGITFAMEAFF